MTLVTRHSSPVTVFVALGSNLDDPPAQIRSALNELARLPGSRLIRSSALYRNPPEGGRAQPDFVNAVAEIETRLAPGELLARLLEIERAHGRSRSIPNAPRTLDLDIVLYGRQAVRGPDLVIPHPRMRHRPFVMLPLLEIAPAADVPGHGRVADLARMVDSSGMIKLAEA